jgi:P-type Cu2+ transporter
MHPRIREDKPGLCSECGMNLIATNKKHFSHDHSEHQIGKSPFLIKFWVSAILSIPVILYSPLPEKLFGFTTPSFPGSRYIGLILGSIVFFYAGFLFLASGWRELRAKSPGMMTLISLAISVAYGYSIISVFVGSERTLFWELTTLIAVMLLGHHLEMRAVGKAQGALKELQKLLPDTAEVLRNGVPQSISLKELKVGDRVLVRPGGKISVDGVIRDGASSIDESIVTGESRPVSKKTGDAVIAGTINGDGSLTIEITKIGEATFLSGIIRLIRDAESSKSKLQKLSDKAAFILTITAIIAGVVTYIAWAVADAEFAYAIERVVAVLVIACPHALGLAIPLVASISTTLSVRNGFLIRKRIALESARKINTVLFDKTGTLTKGEYGVVKVWAIKPHDENKVVQLAASVDAKSEHFIAKAIVSDAKKRSLQLSPLTNFSRIPGKGVQGNVENKAVLVGGVKILEHTQVELPKNLVHEIQTDQQRKNTILFVIEEKKLIGILALADVIREESREAIAELKKRGIKTAMITGDAKEVAEWVARELGLDEYFAEVLPEKKAMRVKLLQEKGEKVAMVGDGVNDAPALTQADIGIAIGAGTNIAIESADIILIKNDPRDILKIFILSRLTYRKMIQNLFWATGYNIIAIPAAAGAFVFIGFPALQPALGAFLMSVSTVIVAINAMLLRNKKLS